ATGAGAGQGWAQPAPSAAPCQAAPLSSTRGQPEPCGDPPALSGLLLGAPCPPFVGARGPGAPPAPVPLSSPQRLSAHRCYATGHLGLNQLRTPGGEQRLFPQPFPNIPHPFLSLYSYREHLKCGGGFAAFFLPSVPRASPEEQEIPPSPPPGGALVPAGAEARCGDLVGSRAAMLASLGRCAGRLLRAGGTGNGLGTGLGRRHAGGGVHIEPRYRQFPELTRAQAVRSELLSGLMWFWILWHMWHSSDMVLGHFPYPDPAAWTDEELGIPPDDAE
uniref:NADH dehydrogenase [ubiquinone] 1 beta subcomplex subunit 2, mitochondrial n=2 Tax=Anas TaxID=8835 RepID=A0A8B9VYE7_9AVES